MASRLLRTLDAAASAAAILPRKEDFPGVSEFLWNQPWQPGPWDLDYPKAASLVPTVYACTTLIANDVAGVPLKFYTGKGKKRVEIERARGNIVDLWERANPEQSGYEVERDRELSLKVSGNAYLYLERFGQSGPPDELWTIPGHLMAPVPGPRRSARQYEYHGGGKIDRYEAEQIIHFRLHNPSWSPLEPSAVGLSPLEAARMAYEARFNMARWQQTFFERGGQTNMVFSIRDQMAAGATDAKVKQWQESLDRRFNGIRNAFKAVIVNGMDILRSGLTLQEMQFVETAKLTDADICRVYFVPPLYVGIKEGGGLSDAGATTDALIYVENAIKPAVRLRDAVFNEKLCPLFGEGIACESDLSGLLAIQRARLDQAKGLKELTGRPIYTVNEARDAMGDYEAEGDETADQLVVPSTVMLAEDLLLPDPIPVVAPPAGSPAPAPKPAQPPAAARAGLSRRAMLGRRRELDRAKYERRIAAWARGYFAAQERRALSSLEAQKPAETLSLVYSVDDMMDPDGRAAAAAQALFEQLILERGAAAAAEVGVEVALVVTSGQVADLIRRQSSRLVTQIDETTREALRQALAAAVAEQASFADVVAAVRRVFDDRRQSALTIARTETTWAYNVASMAAWQEAGVERKTWLTIGDEVVRDSHMRAESEGPIPLGQRFSNGLMYPGDPDADGAEVINCRCVIEADFEVAPAESTLGHVLASNGNRIKHLLNGVAR